jgi:ubiquinone biosynthesis monooxygenase Coq7
MLNRLDTLIVEFDRGLRTLLAKPHSARAHPDANIAEADLTESEKKQAGALMRVNHTGEICAQALYSGQSLTSKSAETTAALKQAALEETEHLAWCKTRISDLGGRTSLLNPLFYFGSFSLGAIAGAVGDKWSLGFVEETEKQVEQMQQDEAKHANEAKQHGAAELPAPAKFLMQQVSKLMTSSSYYL